MITYDLKNQCGVLAEVAQWTERCTGNKRVTGCIPSWGTCLGCRPGPQ